MRAIGVVGVLGAMALAALAAVRVRRRTGPGADPGAVVVGALAVVLLFGGVVAWRVPSDPPPAAVTAGGTPVGTPMPTTTGTRPANTVPATTAPATSEAPTTTTAASSTTTAPTTTARPTSTPAPTTAPTTAAPAPTAAPRVLLLGDSLVWQSQTSFTTELNGRGAEVRLIGGPKQCLDWNNSAWAGELRQAVATYRPDIVVLESAIFNELDRKYFDGLPDTDADVARWTVLAEQLTDIAQAGGAQVHWVLAPIPGPGAAYYGPVATRVPQANAIYRQISAARGLSVIDWGQVFSPDGQYHETVPDEQGNPVVVHVADQMHFNEAGQALMARFTARALFG